MFVFSLTQKYTAFYLIKSLIICHLSVALISALLPAVCHGAEPDTAAAIPPVPTVQRKENNFAFLGPHGYLPALSDSRPTDPTTPTPVVVDSTPLDSNSSHEGFITQDHSKIASRFGYSSSRATSTQTGPAMPAEPSGYSIRATFHAIRTAQIWWISHSTSLDQQEESPSDLKQSGNHEGFVSNETLPMATNRLAQGEDVNTNKQSTDQDLLILNKTVERHIESQRTLSSLAVLARTMLPLQETNKNNAESGPNIALISPRIGLINKSEASRAQNSENPAKPNQHPPAQPLPVDILGGDCPSEKTIADVANLDTVEAPHSAKTEDLLIGSSAIIFSLEEPYLSYDLNPNDRTPSRITLHAPIITPRAINETVKQSGNLESESNASEIWSDFDFILFQHLPETQIKLSSPQVSAIAVVPLIRQPHDAPPPPPSTHFGKIIDDESVRTVGSRGFTESNLPSPAKVTSQKKATATKRTLRASHVPFLAGQLGHALHALREIQLMAKHQFARELDSQWLALHKHWYDSHKIAQPLIQFHHKPSTTGIALLRRAEAIGLANEASTSIDSGSSPSQLYENAHPPSEKRAAAKDTFR